MATDVMLSALGTAIPLTGDMLYEVVNGQVVEATPMGAFESVLANELFSYLYQFTKSKGLGRTVVEVLFLLDAAKNLQRRPDIAFVSSERWPRNKRVPRTAAWAVVPDLPIEVISKSNTAEEVLAKIGEYFQSGCKRVWVVYPTVDQVYVYHSPTQVRILSRQEELDGEDILPGFRLPLATLFEEPAEE